MPTFLLAGFNRSILGNLRKMLEDNPDRLNGWTCQLLPGRGARGSVLSLSQVPELQNQAAELAGAPIFGVSEDSQRRLVAAKISRHFRFRWIDQAAVNKVARKDVGSLLDELDRATVEENFWNDNVRPTAISSPLMLPEQFSTCKDLEDTWRLSKSYNNLGHLKAAVERSKRFTQEYRKKVDGKSSTPWVDRGSWCWEDGGERHGHPEFPGGWKFAFEIPPGFHFDVQPPAGNKSPVFKDSFGKRHAPNQKRYWNITVHGNLRGQCVA